MCQSVLGQDTEPQMFLYGRKTPCTADSIVCESITEKKKEEKEQHTHTHTNKHRKALSRIAIGQKILYLPLYASTAVWAGKISGISLRQHILNRALKPRFLAFLFTTLFRCTVVLNCYQSTMCLVGLRHIMSSRIIAASHIVISLP